MRPAQSRSRSENLQSSMVNNAVHQLMMLMPRTAGGVVIVRFLSPAKELDKTAFAPSASSSMPTTTSLSRHRRLCMDELGAARSFARRTSINVVPAYCPALRRGCPSQVRGRLWWYQLLAGRRRLRSLRCGDCLVCGCGPGFSVSVWWLVLLPPDTCGRWHLPQVYYDHICSPVPATGCPIGHTGLTADRGACKSHCSQLLFE